MTEDAKAIVLLCGRLGDRGNASPLGQSEYARVVNWLRAEGLRPADLLQQGLADRAAAGAGLAAERLDSLLTRGVQLGFAVERWEQSGLWVLGRSDPDYPARLKSHLRERAPPILYGAGDRTLLAGGGLAIVGSRDVDDAGQRCAEQVAAWCARHGMNVVSGGARGVDRHAITSALDAGGAVIGVLADSLLRQSVARDARDAIADSRLLLLSMVPPEAPFSVGSAMGRNKLIYAMADHALVVSSADGKGGTWTGANEELEREGGRTVFVRIDDSAPPGNRALLGRRAVAFPGWTADADPRAVLSSGSDAPASTVRTHQRGLFDDPPMPSDPPESVREEAPAPRPASLPASPQASPQGASRESPAPIAVPSVYDAVLPLILAALDEAVTADELASRLDVGKTQLLAWLRRAVDERRVRKLDRPARFIRRGR